MVFEWIKGVVDSVKIVRVVEPYEGGIRIRRPLKYPIYMGLSKVIPSFEDWAGESSVVDELDPGYYFVLPLLHTMHKTSTTLNVFETDATGGLTSDGQDVHVKTTVHYRVTDPRIALMDIMDVKDAIKDVVCGTVHASISRRNFDAFLCDKASQRGNISQLEQELLQDMRESAEEWGLGIRKVQITYSGKIRNLRIHGDGSSDVSDGYIYDDGE